MSPRTIPALLAAQITLAGCVQITPVPPPQTVQIEPVRQIFPVRLHGRGGMPRAGDTSRLIAELGQFVNGRMDALHVALPPGRAMDGIAWQLQLHGVLRRKIRRDAALLWAGRRGEAEIAATRYVALVPPCPALDLTGAAFGSNHTRMGFGCATLADEAAQISDPADLLGNDAVVSPDPERAALPVAQWRAFKEPKGPAGPLTSMSPR